MKPFDSIFESSIEDSLRKIFRIFFDSRLYTRTNISVDTNDYIAVNLPMDCEGRKVVSLYVERVAALKAVRKLADVEQGGDDMLYDVVGEMANIVAGNALSQQEDENAKIYSPVPLRKIDTGMTAKRVYSTSLGSLFFTVS